MLKLGFLVSGSGTNLQAVINNIKDAKLAAKIVVVISNKSDAFALKRAEKEGIKTITELVQNYDSKDMFELVISKHLEDEKVDLVVLAGFMYVLGEKFIENFKGRIINIHPSLIPSFCGKGYYGKKVHEAALKRGVKLTGATVHILDEGTDTGPILLQKAVEVKDGDTAETLGERVLKEAEWELLTKAIKLFEDSFD